MAGIQRQTEPKLSSVGHARRYDCPAGGGIHASPSTDILSWPVGGQRRAPIPYVDQGRLGLVTRFLPGYRREFSLTEGAARILGVARGRARARDQVQRGAADNAGRVGALSGPGPVPGCGRGGGRTSDGGRRD